MELNDVFVNTDLLRLLATVAAAAVLAAITAVMVAFGTHKVVSYFKLAWLNLRSKVDIVIEAVDQDDDPANMAIDRALDHITPADWNKLAARFLPPFLRAVAEGLDSVIAQPQEDEVSTPPDQP